MNTSLYARVTILHYVYIPGCIHLEPAFSKARGDDCMLRVTGLCFWHCHLKMKITTVTFGWRIALCLKVYCNSSCWFSLCEETDLQVNRDHWPLAFRSKESTTSETLLFFCLVFQFTACKSLWCSLIHLKTQMTVAFGTEMIIYMHLPFVAPLSEDVEDRQT